MQITNPTKDEIDSCKRLIKALINNDKISLKVEIAYLGVCYSDRFSKNIKLKPRKDI